MTSKNIEKNGRTPEEMEVVESQEKDRGSIQILEHAGNLMVKGWILMENED